MKALKNNTSVLNLTELTDYQWEHMRFIRPYQKKNILGKEYAQNDDKACLWVFVANKEVAETFVVPRETVDCIDLPNQVFKPSEAIFIIDDGSLKVRKKFQRR